MKKLKKRKKKVLIVRNKVNKWMKTRKRAMNSKTKKMKTLVMKNLKKKIKMKEKKT